MYFEANCASHLWYTHSKLRCGTFYFIMFNCQGKHYSKAEDMYDIDTLHHFVRCTVQYNAPVIKSSGPCFLSPGSSWRSAKSQLLATQADGFGLEMQPVSDSLELPLGNPGICQKELGRSGNCGWENIQLCSQPGLMFW